MHIFGAIMTFIGIVCLAVGCVLALNKMKKMQDLNFKQKNPTEFKKLKSNITAYIFVGAGIFGFIIGFICLNFV